MPLSAPIDLSPRRNNDLSKPLNAIAEELGLELDIRQLEVRSDEAPPGREPGYTMNILADRSILFSTYAKILVDVATAASQQGGRPSTTRCDGKQDWPRRDGGGMVIALEGWAGRSNTSC